MQGTIVVFRFASKTPHSAINQFCKRFYGQDTSSHRGKYRYHLHGLLDEIPHHRLMRQVVIVRRDDAGKVADFLRQYPLEIHVRTVNLTEEDRRILRLPLG